LRTNTVRTDTQTHRHTDRHTPMTTRPCGLRRAGNYIDSWLNELKLELNNAKTEMNWTCFSSCYCSCNVFQARLIEKKFRLASAFTLFCVEIQMLHHH